MPETIAAPAAAPSATPAAASTPASTPSAPSSPAPAATPSSASTPATAPASGTGSTLPPAVQPNTAESRGKTIEQLARERHEARLKAATDPAPATDNVADDAQADDAQGETTDDEQAAEGDDDQTADDQQDSQSDDQQADGDDDSELELVPHTALAAKELAAKIEGNPALKQALEADPGLRNELFANARLAAAATEYREVFASPVEARVAAEGFSEYTGIRESMGTQVPGDVESTNRVLSTFLEASVLRDADGKPILRADGTPQTDGTVGTLLRNAFQLRMEQVLHEAQQSGDDDAVAALELTMERVGLRTPSSAGNEDEPEDIKQTRESLRQEKARIEQERQEHKQQAETSYYADVNQRLDGMVDSTVSKLLARADGLSDFAREKVADDITAALSDLIKKSPTFRTELARTKALPYGPDRASKHLALATRYLNDRLSGIATPLIERAGGVLKNQIAKQQATQTARANAARSETRGNLRTTNTQAPATGAELTKVVTQELSAKLGRSPSVQEILLEKSKRLAHRSVA